LDKLKFKTFIFPINPEVYQEDYVRDPVYARTDDGSSVFSGMGPMKRVITGSGAFFGADASENFNKLSKMFDSVDEGTLTHPIWGERRVYFTKLQMTQSPKSDYVAYSFEFKEADADGAIPK
jgi:hypothetical protein